MTAEYVPARGQKFDIGRTINFAKCDCPECDFLHCPKNNYAVKMVRKKFSVKTFWENNKEEILKLNKPKRWMLSFPGRFDLVLTYSLIDDLFDTVSFPFPKGTYWSASSPRFGHEPVEETVYRSISLARFTKSGKEFTVGTVEIEKMTVCDIDMNMSQTKLANKIADALTQLRELIFAYYDEKDADSNVGWLSPTGRHYPCGYGQHSTLADVIGGGEFHLEHEGWVKIISSDDEDGFLMHQRFPSAEQRNWLSTHGYNLEDYEYEQTV